MASAGTVTLNLDANSVKLLRELKKSQRATQNTAQKMRRSMGRAFAAIRSAVLSASAVMSAFAAFRGFNRLAGEIDKIGKLVDRLGGSTEAFSELQFVAERSGVAFNSLTMGLQRMQRRVAEAAVGTGEAKNALKELNINAVQLSKLSIDQQFERLADALFRVKTDGDRTRLAMKLLDSEGVALLQIMRSGAAGIRELRQEAIQLGRSLSRDQVDAATKAKDAITSLEASFNALGITLAVKVAPAIADITEHINNVINPSQQLVIMRRMDEIRKALSFEDSTLARGRRGGANRTAVNQLLAEFEELRQKLEALKAPASEAGGAMDELNEIFVTNTKRTDTYGIALAAFSKSFQTAEMRAESLRSKLKHFGDDLDPRQIQMVRDEIASLFDIEEIEVKTREMSDTLKQLYEHDMSEYAKQAARNIQDAFAEFLFDPFDKGVKGMLESFLIAIRRMVANQMAANLFSSGGFFSNLFSGKGAPLIEMAAGGPVSGGSSYLVGERGPELFVPQRSGSIIPNDKMGGVTNVYNFQAGADIATIRAEIIPMLESTQQSTLAQVYDQKRRGLL